MNRIHIFLFPVLLISSILSAQNPLAIPPALTGITFELNLQNGSRTFFPGSTTTTMGVNGDLLGPTLILNAGEVVTMNVHNNLGEETTIHWHGMHVSAANDGGPHTVIEPGTTWSPQFEVLDKASTYWYHPHLHEKTAEHVTKGIAGFIIVKDAEEAALDLPRTYGLDDFPIVLQSRAFDADKQFIVETAADDLMMVNGTLDAYLDAPAQVVRLRLLNGSTNRTYNLGFNNNITFSQIASDGGLLDASLTMMRLRLSPGERAEVLVNLTGMEGQSVQLISYASELQSGIYGATNPSVMPIGGINGYASNPLNGSDFNVLQINVGAATADPVTSIPSTLVTNTPYSVADVQATRSLLFQPQQMGPTGMINGPFVINGATFNMDVINLEIPLNNTEIWELTNMTAISHPFHIHDVQFYILDIDGAMPPANMRGRKDVVMVPPMGGTVRFITKFEDFADPDVPYMYHCHMLSHEDDGMMGQFLVTGDVTASEEILGTTYPVFELYPNPVSDKTLQLNINLPEAGELEVALHDFAGQVLTVYHLNGKGIGQHAYELNLPDGLAAGIYLVHGRLDGEVVGMGKVVLR